MAGDDDMVSNEADPAGERARLVAHPQPGKVWVQIPHRNDIGSDWIAVDELPATPDAEDASICQHGNAVRPSTVAACGCIHAGDASTSASKPLSEAEREGLANTVRDVIGRSYGFEAICHEVERIVAAREAKARAEAGERIAQAIEAKAAPLYPHARRDLLDAARIAREVTR